MCKTVPQVTKKQELLITRAQHVPAEPITLYGISTNANRGPIVPAASTSLPTAQALQTVYVAAVRRINFQLPPTRCRVWTGRFVNQVSTSSDMVMLLTTVFAKAA